MCRRLQGLEDEAAATQRRWQQEREEQQALSAKQRSEEAQQRARLEAVQAETDFTKQQLAALRHKLNNKLAGRYRGCRRAVTPCRPPYGVVEMNCWCCFRLLKRTHLFW